MSATSFRTRLAAGVSALALVPLVVFAVVTSARFRAQETQSVNDTLAADAESFERILEASLADRESALRSWAEGAIVRGALIYASYEKSDAVLAVAQKRYADYSAIALFTPDGTAVSANTPDIVKAYAGKQSAVAQSAWFKNALANNDRLTSEGLEEVDPILGRRVLHLAVPVVSADDASVTGVLMAAFDWERMQDQAAPALARARSRSQSSLELLIARPDGRLLFDSSTSSSSSNNSSAAADAAARTLDIGPLAASAARTGSGMVGGKLAAFVVDTSARRDVGDGWIVLALLDPGEAYAPVNQLLTLVAVLVGVLAVVSVLIAFLLARRLVQPINALNDVVGRIVREGDLTARIDIPGTDEVGMLAASFADMVVKLREIPLALRDSSTKLLASVNALSTSTSEQSQTITRQAAALQEAQVTAQEIKQTSLLASQKAESVLRVAERADEIGRSGEAAIEQSLSGFSEMRDQVSDIAARIRELGDRTRQIGGITQTVKDLADQSNMLALNAAIEAVRSGEHGKGFAVVAREIRSLADQSIQSTNRVREILDDIGAAVASAVASSERGAARMEVGLVQVKASGENLKELSNIVRDNSAAVRQIAAAVSQQNAGIAQIFSAITDLSRLMDDTLKRIDSTHKAGQTLNDVAVQVSRVVDSFRV